MTEAIVVRNDFYVPLAFEFNELDEAQHVARELLRLAAEWRAQATAEQTSEA